MSRASLAQPAPAAAVTGASRGTLPRSPLPMAQRRGMFIQTQTSPNEHSLLFLPGQTVMAQGTFDFPTARAAMVSPLAKVSQ